MNTLTKKNQQVSALELRETFKAIIQSELEKMPELLAELNTKERLEILCKLLPYAFPKVDSVHFTVGEDFITNFFNR
jgi:hypothetical protein